MQQKNNCLWDFYFESYRPHAFLTLASMVVLWFRGLSRLIMMEEKHTIDTGIECCCGGGGGQHSNWNDIITSPLAKPPSPPLSSPSMSISWKTGTCRDNPIPTHTYKNTHAHARTHARPRARAQLKALQKLTYETVGAAGTQHVEGDAGLCVKVQPPLVVLLGEDEVERVTGAPFLRRLHQMLELHPLLSGLRCPWLRSLISISLAVTAMMLKTQITADRTAASAASTTASPLAHRLHGPGIEIA